MNFCAEVGEQTLKTEAKEISRSAQQWGEVTFELQTSERVLEHPLPETCGDAIDDNLTKVPMNT